MPSRRLVRRRSFATRLRGYLDPWDYLLRLYEELDSSDWEQWLQDWSTPLGISQNFIMLIARANCGGFIRGADDVFGEDVSASTWMTWLLTLIVWVLSTISVANAAWTFLPKRHYRLFEVPIDAQPSTPSAQRVRVDSSPMSSSPLRYLSSLITPEAPEVRAYPDAARDVWELRVWDPKPSAIQLFCYFSPGHVLVYWLFLPTIAQDPRPSTTVATTILLAALLSFQMNFLQSSFTQLSKDTSVIQKEVLNEYDVKYVHPRTQPLVRDVGTQFSRKEGSDSIDVYTPVTIINKGFHTNPNPVYLGHIGPQAVTCRSSPTANKPSGSVPVLHTPAYLHDLSSPVQSRAILHQPQFRPAYQNTGDGGSLGVHTHARSPLRKSASTNFVGGYRERERSMSPTKYEGSPLKRSSLAAGGNMIGAGAGSGLRFSQLRDNVGGEKVTSSDDPALRR